MANSSSTISPLKNGLLTAKSYRLIARFAEQADDFGRSLVVKPIGEAHAFVQENLDTFEKGDSLAWRKYSATTTSLYNEFDTR